MNPYRLSDEEDPQLMDSLTPGTSQQLPPPPQAMPSAPPPPTQAAPPPMQTPPPVTQAPPPRLPGMPPGMTPDTLSPYLSKQRAQLNKFGPEQRMALQDSLNARQNSFGNKATEGLKGFADALMMGVARAGNPGWQQGYQNQEQQYAQNQTNALKESGDLNQKQVESNMSLDRMDPRSPTSKTAQESYAPLFEKLGYPPGKLQGMSAANIDSALQLMAAYGGKEMEAKIKEYELEIERTRLAAAVGKNATDEEIAREKIKTDAAKEILDKSKNARVWGIPIPGTSDVSGKEEDAARKTLMEQMGSGDITPDVQAYAEKHGISPQQALQIKKARGG